MTLLSLPTSQNKETFKNYLRENKNVFSSNILSARFEEITPLLNAYHNSLTSGTLLNMILFDYGDTVNITNSTDIIYLPGLENDVVNLTNGSSTKAVKIKSNGVEVDSNTYGLGQYFTIGTKKYIVWGLGGALLSGSSGPSYTVTQSVTSANEGSVVTFTVNTVNVADSTTLYWTLGGVSGTVTSNDFTTNTSGTVPINSDTGTVQVTIKNDLTTEGSEQFVLQLRTDSTSGTVVATSSTVTINDTSLTPAYSVSLSPTTVAEGATVMATVTTQNIPDGTTLNYNISPTTEVNPHNGVFNITNNTGSFSFVAKRDADVESNETITVNVRDSSNTVVATGTFVITDVPFTITPSLSATVILEGSTITVTLNTTGIPDGTNLTLRPIKLDGNPSPDFDTTVRTVSVTNNVASFPFAVKTDGLTEGTEKIKFKIENSEGDKISETGEVTIVDSSFTGKNFANKTFGPISVNRDGGSTSNISEWYDICNIDSIPDGSEIAIFIDNSGSMTTATVQASYNRLIQRLNARNITVATVTNSNEDWITPFDTNTI
tara:strand:+ start:1885 stop:3525 length:1641 start_codon:yes stop_codon:yes gene_type:complete